MKRAIVPALAGFVVGLALAATAPAADFTNFETPQVHPIDLSPDGQWLAVCNTADNRVEIFDLSSGTPVGGQAVFVGVDPVSVRFRTSTELWVVNQISDTVSIVDLNLRIVVDTITTLDEPADVVFAGSPQRAYVSCSQVNTIQVFNPASLGTAPTNLVIKGEDPRALGVSPDGLTVYAAVFESGNKTTILGGSNVSLSFPSDDPVDDPSGPYGGVNPPPNSGNNFVPAINPALPAPPRSGLIVKRNSAGDWMDDNGGTWTKFVSGSEATRTGHRLNWVLLDHDVARINTATNAISYTDGLMNICMALGVNPANGNVHVVGTEATNEIRFEPNLTGTFVRVRHARFTPAAPTTSSISDLNPHLSYAVSNIAQTEREKSIGDPRAIAFRGDGTRGYIAGMGSNNVIVVDAAGARAGLADTIPVGEGPTGIAIDNARGQFYVLNRFEGSVSVVNLASETETARIAFFDPTPAEIKNGRPFLFDTHLTSGLGQVACASCHVDTRMDRLAWDLGDPSGVMKNVNSTQHNLGSNIPGPPTDGAFDNFHPMKGPMLTQTLQDIIGKEPLHWRGDKDGIEEFNGAFVFLQGDNTGLGPTEMQAFEDYLATIHFPPNPYRNLDNTLPTNLAMPGHFRTGRFSGPAGTQLPNGNAQRALNTLYRPFSRDACGGGSACVTCHTLPTGAGTENRWISLSSGYNSTPIALGPNGEHHLSLVPGVGASQKVIKNIHLRNMYDRVGFDVTQTENTAGFGFFHDGSVDSLARFNEFFTLTTEQENADMVALMLAFSGSDFGGPLDIREPPGVASKDAPASVGKQATITSTIDADLGFLNQLLAIANTGKVDLVAKGLVNGVPRGWKLIAGTGSSLFQTDRVGINETLATITSRATPTSPVTFTVVMKGNGTRLGLDRDRDGLLDDDEFRDLHPEIPGWQNPFAGDIADATGNNGSLVPDGIPDGQNDFDGDGIDNATELLNGTSPVGNLTANPPFVADVDVATGGAYTVHWTAAPLGQYQVQYSPDMVTWFDALDGAFQAGIAGGPLQWTDTGPPNTTPHPDTVARRFYRVVRLR